MNTEFSIDINASRAKIYMQAGFFNHKDMNFPAHKHVLCEIHVLLSGTAALECNKEKVLLREGDAICVPAQVKHAYQSVEKDSKRITFFVDYDYKSVLSTKVTFSATILSLLSKEIQEYVLTGNDNKLKPLLSYVCAHFFVEEVKRTICPISNRAIIIDDFFSKKYNKNATLEELAKELMLSKKQTEREVKKATGNTFIGELSKRKMEAAIMLTQTTNLSLTQISELVGYSSYSGLYKAYKRMNDFVLLKKEI